MHVVYPFPSAILSCGARFALDNPHGATSERKCTFSRRRTQTCAISKIESQKSFDVGFRLVMSTFQVYKYGYVERFMFHDWYDVGPLRANRRIRRSPQPPPDHHAQLRADPKGGPRTELPGRAARDLAERNGRPLHGTSKTARVGDIL